MYDIFLTIVFICGSIVAICIASLALMYIINQFLRTTLPKIFETYGRWKHPELFIEPPQE